MAAHGPKIRETIGAWIWAGLPALITRYQHPCGEFRLRVTTLSHRVSDTTNLLELAQAFDQEAATVLAEGLF